MYEPAEPNLSKDGAPSGRDVIQHFYAVEPSGSSTCWSTLLAERGVDSVLVFTRTKHGADKMADTAAEAGSRPRRPSTATSPETRNRALEGFRAGTFTVLVATDVAGRGIDVDNICHVINFDIPDDRRELHPPHRPHRPGDLDG